MSRAEQIAHVESQFAELASFAKSSWSNIEIVERIKALQVEVQELYPAVLIPAPAPPPLPVEFVPTASPTDEPICDGEGRLIVGGNTRWG